MGTFKCVDCGDTFTLEGVMDIIDPQCEACYDRDREAYEKAPRTFWLRDAGGNFRGNTKRVIGLKTLLEALSQDWGAGYMIRLYSSQESALKAFQQSRNGEEFYRIQVEPGKSEFPLVQLKGVMEF